MLTRWNQNLEMRRAVHVMASSRELGCAVVQSLQLSSLMISRRCARPAVRAEAEQRRQILRKGVVIPLGP